MPTKLNDAPIRTLMSPMSSPAVVNVEKFDRRTSVDAVLPLSPKLLLPARSVTLPLTLRFWPLKATCPVLALEKVRPSISVA